MGRPVLRAAREEDSGDRYIWEMLQDIGAEENGFMNPARDVAWEDFPAHLSGQLEKGRNPGPGRVPQTIFWLLDGGEVLGFSKMRHCLNEGLMKRGGHIGYGIRASRRGLGHGRTILALTLAELAKLGVDRALLTCDAANLPSRRVIEANGGILESEEEGELRYWIGLPSPAIGTGRT